MKFRDVYGNDALKARLALMVQQNRVGHAIMFEERSGDGAVAIAIALAQYLSCENRGEDSCGECSNCRRIAKGVHPDLHFVFPVNVTAKSGSDKKPVSETFLPIWRELLEKNPRFTEEELNEALGIEDKMGVIGVNEAKEILKVMNMRSFEGGNKYMIVWLPERMNTEAANKLLKMIEEPYPGSYFFLITQAPEKVIDTIRSRCLRVQLQPVPVLNAPDTDDLRVMMEDLISAASSQNLVEVLKCSEKLAAIGRERQRRFCLYGEEFVRSEWMKKMKGESQEGWTDAAEKLYSAFEGARSSIESNVNAKIVFTNLGNLLWFNLR